MQEVQNEILKNKGYSNLCYVKGQIQNIHKVCGSYVVILIHWITLAKWHIARHILMNGCHKNESYSKITFHAHLTNMFSRFHNNP